MAAQSLVLDQGNIFLRHLMEGQEVKGNDSSDESSVVPAEEDSEEEEKENPRASKTTKDALKARTGVENSQIYYGKRRSYQSDNVEEQVRNEKLIGNGSIPQYAADKMEFAPGNFEGDSDGTMSGTEDVLNDSKAQNGIASSRRGSHISRQSSHHLRRQSQRSESSQNYTTRDVEHVDEDREDDARDDSDDVDEDDEDRMPGLARAHLNYEDNEDVQKEDEPDAGDSDGHTSRRSGSESPPQRNCQDESGLDMTDTKLTNPDVVDDSELMDTVKAIGVSSLSQLQRLNKNDPAVKRLFVRPRLSIREVKAIRLDPDIKAIVDDFLKTNITGDFTIARVLRENYASFHPWLASHIQAERNAWAVKLRQAMDAGEKARREGLDSAALAVEAGLRLRELVQTCSCCMYGYPKSQAHTTTAAPAATRKGPCPSTGKGATAEQFARKAHAQGLSSSEFSAKSKPEASSSHLPPGRAHASNGSNGAGSVFRLNGLAKASLAPGVEFSALNQKLARLKTIVSGNGEKGGEHGDRGNNTMGLTPSPMNMLRVEDSNVYNYESDPGVYSPAHDIHNSSSRHVRRRPRRGLHEGFLYSKKTVLSTGATTTSDSIRKCSSNRHNNTSSFYKRFKESYHQSNISSRTNQVNAWVLLDLDTLLEREFGPGSDGNVSQNGTDWTEVVRGNIDVLTELCQTLVTERLDCLDTLGSGAGGESDSLLDALREYTRARQEDEERRQEEMEYRLQQLEDENQALQAEMSALQKTLSDTNVDALNLRRQLVRLEALVNGEQPERVNKCVGTADLLPSFLPKPRIFGANSSGGGGGKNGISSYNTLHTATVVYAGGGSNRYTAKATLLKSKQKKREKGFRRTSQYFSEPYALVSDSEAGQEESANRGNTKPNLSPRGCEVLLETQKPDAERDGDSEVVVPQIRLGLATRERSLVEISEEKLQTLKQRAQRLETSLHDAINSMERVNKSTPQADDSSSLSGVSISSRHRERRRPTSVTGQRPRLWTEASFEVTGSPPPQNNSPQGTSNNSSSNNNNKNSHTIDANRTPRSCRLAVIKRPAEYNSTSNHLPERRAASEILPYTLEHEKSSLLSGRAVALAPTASPEKTSVQPGMRQKASPASVHSTSSNKDKNNTNNSKLDKGNMSTQNDSKRGTYPNQNSKLSTMASRTSDSHSSSFYNNATSQNKTTATSNPSSKITVKESSDSSTTGSKKVISRLKPARAGGVVAKCLRCQKLFNSVDNHKLACCYHPKEKARFEHYDGSGRLVAVVLAWQCCQQAQDADGCCFGQHV